MNKYKCPYCEREFDSYDSMRRHSSRHHKINSQQCYVDYYFNGEWPTCKCGCNQIVKWDAAKGEFRDFVQGHQSRVNNNWGHNKKAIEKSAETRRRQFANGDREVWNKGLNTKSDNRVIKNGESVSRAFTQDRKNRYADIMRNNRLNGIVPSLYGANHPQWKGGSSTVQQITRGSKRHYDTWKYPILKRDGFKCQECESEKDLQVHHDDISFSDIIQIVMLENRLLAESDSYDDKKVLADKVIDYHINKNVSGITICKECHCKIHPSLNL